MPTGKPTEAVEETATRPARGPRLIDVATAHEVFHIVYTGTEGQLVAAIKSGVVSGTRYDRTSGEYQPVHFPTSQIIYVKERE